VDLSSVAFTSPFRMRVRVEFAEAVESSAAAVATVAAVEAPAAAVAEEPIAAAVEAPATAVVTVAAAALASAAVLPWVGLRAPSTAILGSLASLHRVCEVGP
jgi:hypothetical protein